MIARLAKPATRQRIGRLLQGSQLSTSATMGFAMTQTSRLWVQMHTAQLLQPRQTRSQSFGSTTSRSFHSSPAQNQAMPTHPVGERIKNPSYSIFKPNAVPERGSSILFNYSYDQKCVFINAASQKGAKLPPGSSGSQFDWEQKIVMKISLNELGKMLSVLEGQETVLSMFHTSEREGVKTSTTCKLEKHQTGKYAFSINKQHPQEPQRSIFLYIELSEAAILKEFLRTSIRFGVGFT